MLPDDAALLLPIFFGNSNSPRTPPNPLGSVTNQVPFSPGAPAPGPPRGMRATRFLDTHCHLDLILRQARRPVTPASWVEFASRFPDSFEGSVNVCCFRDSLPFCEAILGTPGVHSTWGIHPHSAAERTDEWVSTLRRLLAHPSSVAVGECGLDYFKNSPDTHPQQRAVFVELMGLAVELGKPLVVHTRAAEDDTFDLMTRHLPHDHPIHVHCFTGSWELAQKLLERFSRLYFGFTGVITFKGRSADPIREVVRSLPLTRILLETDGPFMAPEPHRGDVAHPGLIPFVAEAVAKALGVPVAEVYDRTRANARAVYGI